MNPTKTPTPLDEKIHSVELDYEDENGEIAKYQAIELTNVTSSIQAFLTELKEEYGECVIRRSNQISLDEFHNWIDKTASKHFGSLVPLRSEI